MNSSVSTTNRAAWKPLVLISALSALSAAAVPSAIAQSADTKVLAPVFVTASRFASDPDQIPIGATVITAEEIREAGVNNVNEAIRRLGGVYGRQNFSGTQDFSLDLRGFGANSDQNLVILVDGIRLTENELAPALLSSIPIESIERIEIVRGGSSVLYGEGATGGTVQIITKRGVTAGTRGTLVGEVGSFGHRELRASVAKGWDGFSLDANVSTQRAENYRNNNDIKQNNFSGGAQWASNEGRVGFRVDVARQDARFAGSLTLPEFQENPRQTNSPNDFGSVDTNRYTFFAERRFGALDVAAELSRRDRTSTGFFDSAFGAFNSRADSRTTQFSPRIRHTSESGGVKNELVAGLDFTRWSRRTDSDFGGIPTSAANASQSSRGIYVRDEIRFGSARIAAGARHEIFDKAFSDPLGFRSTAYNRSQSLNAWELQGAYQFAPTLSAFAKFGRSYRVANADENGATPMLNQPLEPQMSQDFELGMKLGDAARNATARVFRHRLTNEVFYNPILFTNINLAPTQRKGIELEGNIRLMSAFMLSANLQHIAAEFRGGVNAGNEMVLVPRNTASVRLTWLPETGQSAHVGVQWVDSQRYGDDIANACAIRVPSFTTLDARYAVRAGAWEFAVAGTNLTNRQYFTSAFGTFSNPGACEGGIYPDVGRQIKVSARLDF